MTQIDNVWIIDDDPITCLIAKFTVKAVFPKSRVQTFDSGVPALELLRDLTEVSGILPDIIFLDIKMPYMNGFEFLEKVILQKTPIPATKIYIYSNSINTQHMEQARASKLPIYGFVTKPLTHEKLKELF